MEKELIENAMKEIAVKYSESPATTNAGRWLRFISILIPWETVVKIFAHKLSR